MEQIVGADIEDVPCSYPKCRKELVKRNRDPKLDFGHLLGRARQSGGRLKTSQSKT
jgi:hypothetical protein